ncbi:hypothetical protein [Shinella granuli]|uniref:Mobilization protein MobC n=1 Tax=Shinella granuli TaxID=323621 RepID=A0A4V2RJ08_SHIGR|nr:hypothetical protein [Shinella granuli]TCN46330.1 hypothetical protein EV665_1041 [Shinella granuli]
MDDYPKLGGKRRKSRPEAKNFTLRLTDDEKRLLIERAGDVPLGIYIRGLILGADVRQKRRSAPLKDDTALAQVLALLGQSRLSSNLNQLAKAVHIGALPVTPETESEIVAACAAVSAMRLDLLAALGLPEGGRA